MTAPLPEEDLDLWWLSFTDPDIAETIPEDEQRPGGPSFLGACVVAAVGEASAVSRAWELGINPGGQVMVMGPFPQSTFAPQYRDRLLTADEAENIPEPGQQA